MQDQNLPQAFEPRRQAVQVTVAQVQAQLAPAAPRRSWRPLFLGAGLAAAALIAVLYLWWPGPPKSPTSPSPRMRIHTVPIAWCRARAGRPGRRHVTSRRAGADQGRRAPQAGSARWLGAFQVENTAVHLTGPRQARLERGTVFVEVGAARDGGAAATFVVATPKREVKALGTKFEVQADDAGTGVLVTQGQVQVTGLPRPLQAGELLAAGGDRRRHPRASHVLDWMRSLMAAAESPLVPASKHCGGISWLATPPARRPTLTSPASTSMSISRMALPAPLLTRPTSMTIPGAWRARSTSLCRPTRPCRSWPCMSMATAWTGA